MTNRGEPRIRVLGDQAVVVELGEAIDPKVNARACAVALELERREWPGVRDVVPSFSAVTVHVDVTGLEQGPGGSRLAALSRRLLRFIESMNPIDCNLDSGPEVEIPIVYGGVEGPDLDEAARECGLSPGELVHLHQQPARVYMLGFVPGAPYIGLFDERMSLPRRATPRVRVPAGSVGIANRQCFVYPVDAPGGWSIIGRTPLRFFDPERSPPALLAPGSRVRFRAVEADTARQWPGA